MTEKNFFCRWVFQILVYFLCFYVKTGTPPEKKIPSSFPATAPPLPPLKNWDPVNPPLFENLVGGSTPQQKGGGVGCTLWTLWVHVPVFWTRPSTKGVYKVIENFNLSHEKNQHQRNNIFGRYVDFELHNTRSSHKSRHRHMSPAEFGLYNKYKEINFAPMSENTIYGNGNKFNQNDFVTDTSKGIKSCQNLSEPSQESFFNSSAIGQGYRFPIVHYISSGTC